MGVTSTSEADFLRACRSRGLQTPRMQVRRVAGGRRRRVDAEFRLPDGRVLMVEIDGVAHMDVRQWEADLIRQNEKLTAETGALVLHVTGWQIRHDPDAFFDLLRRLGVQLAAQAPSCCVRNRQSNRRFRTRPTHGPVASLPLPDHRRQ